MVINPTVAPNMSPGVLKNITEKYWGALPEDILSKYYTYVNDPSNRELWDYHLVSIPCASEPSYHSRFKLLKALGSGTFGSVYLAEDTWTGKRVAYKTLKPAQDKLYRIQREVWGMQRMCDAPDAIHLHDVLCDVVDHYEKKPHVVLVMELVENISNIIKGSKEDGRRVKQYFYRILNVLKTAHERGFIHRDIKPNNILYNGKSNQVRVLDWGLVTQYVAGEMQGTGAGTRGYIPPEGYTRFKYFDYSYDIWAVGVMFSSVIFERSGNFFSAVGQKDKKVNYRAKHLDEIVQFLGSREFWKTYQRYHRYWKLPASYGKILESKNYLPKNWTSFAVRYSEKSRGLATPEALDLLSKMMKMDFRERISAADALNHPYFDEVRAEIENELYSRKLHSAECYNRAYTSSHKPSLIHVAENWNPRKDSPTINKWQADGNVEKEKHHHLLQ